MSPSCCFLGYRCGWGYLGINMVANMAFNLSLAWGMLVVSPLACRLFVLLGLPASLVLDAMPLDTGGVSVGPFLRVPQYFWDWFPRETTR